MCIELTSTSAACTDQESQKQAEERSAQLQYLNDVLVLEKLQRVELVTRNEELQIQVEVTQCALEQTVAQTLELQADRERTNMKLEDAHQRLFFLTNAWVTMMCLDRLIGQSLPRCFLSMLLGWVVLLIIVFVDHIRRCHLFSSCDSISC